MGTIPKVILAVLAVFFLTGTALWLPSAWAVDVGYAPVSGQMTSNFGWRTDPINGTQRFHGGIDIAASQGTPVYAPQAGMVVYSGSYGGYGNVVVLSHGYSLFTLYGHNSSLLVQTGQYVARGQIISLVGSTGRSTGPHLHFEVHYNGQYLNPLAYLGYLQNQGGRILAQTQPANVVYSVHQASGNPTAAASSAASASSRTANNGVVTVQKAKRRYSKAAYGKKVVEVVNGSQIQTVVLH